MLYSHWDFISIYEIIRCSIVIILYYIILNNKGIDNVNKIASERTLILTSIVFDNDFGSTVDGSGGIVTDEMGSTK